MTDRLLAGAEGTTLPHRARVHRRDGLQFQAATQRVVDDLFAELKMMEVP